MHGSNTSTGMWVLSILLRVTAFMLVIPLVWITYVYLYAYHPDFLGWCYAQLRPVTVWFYQLIDVWLPEAVKYKVSAGLTDELGPRSLFLLLLGGIGEAVVVSVYLSLVALVRRLMHGGSAASGTRRA